jgi:uncharacterized protein (TIGR02266 family)
MAEERRVAQRVRLAGVRVTYESASGERVEADALDLGFGGLFVRTAAPLAVGKRIALDVQVVGESGPWSLLGRVVWTRDKGEGDQAPPGMGVKLIDADEGVLAAIERLVETRERTEPGVGKPSSPPPPVAPIAEDAPERERAPPYEPSVALDLTPQPPAASFAPMPAPALGPAPAGKAPETGGGAGRWIVIALLLVVAGVAAYVLLDGFLTPPGH